MCHRQVCTPTPKDVLALMEAGYGYNMHATVAMCYPTQLECITALGMYRAGKTDVNIVSFILPRKEEGCIFLTPDNLCSLHDAGLKPTEGKLSLCSDNSDPSTMFYEILKTWATPEGADVLKQFMERYPNNVSAFVGK